MSAPDDRGLYQKYTVTNAETGEEVEGCFVLKPENDTAARQALLSYALWCEPEQPQLAQDLRRWVLAILEGKRDAPTA